MRITSGIIAACFTACLSAGCSSYRIDLTQPAELARTLASEETAIPMPPLEYRMNDLKGRVGIRILNDTDEPMMLVGEKSYAVDPEGQSRPLIGLNGGTIAPRTFLAISVPPIDYVYPNQSGFTFGVAGGSGGGGFGVGMGSGYAGDPYVGGPGYVLVWPWNVGQVHVHLALQHGTELIEQDFAFERIKVK